MQIHYDDEERAILAARLGHTPEVGDRQLAASFAAWVDGKPAATKSRRTLTARDVEHLAGVIDDREAGGYRSDPHYYGVG